MRRITASVLLLFAMSVGGCHKQETAVSNGGAPYAERSIADMEAEYTRLQTQNEKDCLYASPEQIRANQALCDRERKEMAPLGNALMQAKIKAAQHATNP